MKKLEWKGVCHAFERGECTRGHACKFSHGKVSQGVEVVVKSKGVCFDYRRGACERGDKCKFSHGGAGDGKNGADTSGSDTKKSENWGAKKIKAKEKRKKT